MSLPCTKFMRTFNQFELNGEQLARGINPRASPPQRRGPEKSVPERSRPQSAAEREGLATSTTRYFACTRDSIQNDWNGLFLSYFQTEATVAVGLEPECHHLVYFIGFENIHPRQPYRASYPL